MWTKDIQRRFDAAAWNGNINVTTAMVRISMLLGLGALWAGVVLLILTGAHII